MLGGSGILLGSVFISVALGMNSAAAFIVLLTVFAFFSAFALPTLTACVADVVPARDRGLGFGMLQVAATVGGAIGPLLVGAVSDITDSLTTGVVPLLPLLAVGGVLALLAYRSVEHESERVLIGARTQGE